MTASEIVVLNFSEIRRRSIKVWELIPQESLSWRPDEKALTVIEMIRHVLEGEHLFHTIVKNRGNLGEFKSPWGDAPLVSVENELALAQPHRADFIEMIRGFSESDFSEVKIVRSEKGQIKGLGDYLNRIAYHESVHMGQMLDYLRTAGVERALIWD